MMLPEIRNPRVFIWSHKQLLIMCICCMIISCGPYPITVSGILVDVRFTGMSTTNNYIRKKMVNRLILQTITVFLVICQLVAIVTTTAVTFL